MSKGVPRKTGTTHKSDAHTQNHLQGSFEHQHPEGPPHSYLSPSKSTDLCARRSQSPTYARTASRADYLARSRPPHRGPTPPRPVRPCQAGCSSTPTAAHTVPPVRGWAPRRPPLLPHGQVRLLSGPRHVGGAGTPTGPAGAWESLPPRGEPPAWGSPPRRSPRRVPRSSRASRRPGTSGAHGAGHCGRSRRRRSPVPPPPLARPEPRRLPPRRACALGAPLAGAGPERAAEVTRRALKGPRARARARAAEPRERTPGQEDGSVLFATRKRTGRERPEAQISESHAPQPWDAQTDPLGRDSALDTRGMASASIL